MKIVMNVVNKKTNTQTRSLRAYLVWAGLFFCLVVVIAQIFIFSRYHFERKSDFYLLQEADISSIVFEYKTTGRSCLVNKEKEIIQIVQLLKEAQVRFTSHVFPLKEYVITINFKNDEADRYHGFVYNSSSNNFYITGLPVINGDVELPSKLHTYSIPDGHNKLEKSQILESCGM